MSYLIVVFLIFGGFAGLAVHMQRRHEQLMGQMQAERHRGSHGVFNCACHAHLNP